MDADDLKLRQSAAIHILKSVKLYGTNLEPFGDTNPEKIEEKWERDKESDKLLDQLDILSYFGSGSESNG